MAVIIDSGGDEPTTDEAPLSTGHISAESQCIVCGLALEYGGRGPKRKYCDQHKPNPGKGSPGAPKSASKVRGIDTLVDQLADLYRAGSLVVMVIDPIASMTIAEGADKLANSWRPLMERDPKIRRAVEKLCTGSGWGSVVMAHGMIALPILSAHGVLPDMSRLLHLGSED